MPNAPNVLFVSGTLVVGGSETKMVKIANALAQSGYSAAIAYLNPPESLLSKVKRNVPVFHLQRQGKFSVASLRRLRAMIAEKHHVVISVNFYPLLYVVPAVKYMAPVQSQAISLINTTDFTSRQRIIGRIYAPLIRRCDRIVYGCEAQQRLWTKKYRLPSERSEHIYNGVDSEFYSPAYDSDVGRKFRRDLGIPEDAIVVGSIGRFAPEKHFSLAITAVANLKKTGRETYLILVGQGTEKRYLEQKAKELGVFDRVRMPGVLGDVRPAISAMDIFVLPSRAVETFSNAALEAMAMARSVVLSNIGGAAEMVEHSESGFLFDPQDIDELTGFLVMLHDSSQLREQLGLAARRRVLEHFQFETMVDCYKTLIESAIDATQ